MSSIDTIYQSGRNAAGLGRALFRLIGEIELRTERYRTRRALMELSDHQLRDIGVTREEAWREASRPFWG